MRRRFSKDYLYQCAFERGPWQEKWSKVGRLFFSFFGEGVAAISFPKSPSDSVYLKVGEEFIYLGRFNEHGEVEVYWDDILGRGNFVGWVELPTVLEVSESEKGIVGTEWRRVVRNNGALGKEGFIRYREWSEWEGRKVRFKIRLKGYRKYEVRGELWEKIFEEWEEKRRELMEEFFFKEGLPLAERFPPKRKLSPREWREYVVLLGEHSFFKRRMREIEEEREIKRLVWGREEERMDDEWWGFSIVDSENIVGPISVIGLLRFIAGDLEGVLDRRISEHSIPIPAL